MLFGKNGQTLNNAELEITTEAQSLILEAILADELSPEELSAFLESNSEVNAAVRENILLEKTIVRLDKRAKLTRATKMAAFTLAKEKNDILFKKLLTVWRMERMLEAKILKKYQSQAMSRARQAVNNAGKSKAPTIKAVANKVHSQLNGDKINKPAFSKK